MILKTLFTNQEDIVITTLNQPQITIASIVPISYQQLDYSQMTLITNDPIIIWQELYNNSIIIEQSNQLYKLAYDFHLTLTKKSTFEESLVYNLWLLRTIIDPQTLIVKKLNNHYQYYLTLNSTTPNYHYLKTTLTDQDNNHWYSYSLLKLKLRKTRIITNYFETNQLDLVVNAINNHQDLIVVDYSKELIVYPITTTNFFTFPNFPNFFKWPISFFLLFITLILPGLMVAIYLHHPQIFPQLQLLLNKSLNQHLPLIVEIIIILTLLDSYRFIISSNSSIVIILLIGQSGLISPVVLGLMGIASIVGYAITNDFGRLTTLSFLRIIILLAGYFLGIIGVILSVLAIFIYLITKFTVNNQKGLIH